MESILEKLETNGEITSDQARVVLSECAKRNVTESTVLLECEFVSNQVLESYIERELSIDLNTAEFVPDDTALSLLDEAVARRFNALPISFSPINNQLIIAVEELRNVVVRDAIKRSVQRSIQLIFYKASSAEITQALDKCYGHRYTLSAALAELENMSDSLNASTEAAQAPVSRFIDSILFDAVSRRASDIHLTPEKSYLRIRYRVDGVLGTVCYVHKQYWPAMLVRIKVLSELDIAETRLPQDGYLGRIIHGARIDFRVASFPTTHSESLVLRVLDRRQSLKKLDQLCANKRTQQQLEKLVTRPSGMVLVCGPTGAGKTTTLYALLKSLDATSLNIMTLEDPVEFPVVNIIQTRVNGSSALDYAKGVRGVLRQDPDVILVGEIRDVDSCAMCCRAALTGHLVLSSTHASSAVGAISRLLELGASRSVLAGVLSGVVSQRLLRKLCSECNGAQQQCRVCFGTGYSGRVALFECLTMTERFATELQNGATISSLRDIAIEEGMESLVQQARIACSSGITSAEEVIRVIGEDGYD